MISLGSMIKSSLANVLNQDLNRWLLALPLLSVEVSGLNVGWELFIFRGEISCGDVL